MRIDNTINERLISFEYFTATGKLDLEVTFPIKADYFDGHFDGFPILPGIIQIYLIKKFVTKYYGFKFHLKNISNIKFLKPIFPGDRVHIVINLTDRKKIFFEFQRNQNICSKGCFICEL